ncbi:hypothetical protein [Paraherbaspirillum soli]|uniref:Uncharacterized protein n=1 Tax=Paraherbaspirillum soli TaxID=631222 RepID=A0ABW0M9H8_9BURK
MVTKKPVKRVIKKTADVSAKLVKSAPKAALKPISKPAPKAKPASAPASPAKSVVAKPVLPAPKPALSIKPQPEQKVKIKKEKLVRDSFTMPADEYQVLGEVKKTFLKAGLAVKKSELLRVGVALIRKLDLDDLKLAVASLPPVKAGRPKKEK